MEIVKNKDLENVSGGLTNHIPEYKLSDKEVDFIKRCGYKLEKRDTGNYMVLDKDGKSINQKVLEGICTAAQNVKLSDVFHFPITSVAYGFPSKNTIAYRYTKKG